MLDLTVYIAQLRLDTLATNHSHSYYRHTGIAQDNVHCLVNGE